MKKITVVEPQFVSTFKCIGSACRDHCCKNWIISLDKPTVNRYLKSSQIEIKTLAADNIIITRNSYADWGKIKLNPFDSCAFMDENRLCKIHSTLGASALSNTCATYPRLNINYKYEQQKSLILSCPEAVRQLFASPDAMLFEQTIRLQSKANLAKDLDQKEKLLNLMCLHIVKLSGVQLDEAFYALASFLLGVEKISGCENRVEQMENYFSQTLNALAQGEFRHQLMQIKPDYSLQWSLLLRLQTCFDGTAGKRGWATLHHYVKKLIYIQTEGAKADNVQLSMTRLESAWQNKVMPWLTERPWIINNYVQYRIYNDFFPNDKSRSPLLSLYLLTAEWFLLKSIIASHAELVGNINEEDIINVFYSYHSNTKHNTQSVTAFFEAINKTKVNDDLSLLFLLR